MPLLATLLAAQEGSAANGSSTATSSLQWGRPQAIAKEASPRPAKQLQRIRLVPKTTVAKTTVSKNTVALLPKNTASIRRDSYVMAAAWEEEDTRDRSVVVERSSHDPFDEDRLAQLDDPFDEPADDLASDLVDDSELLDVIEDLNADDINSVEDAIEEEINRRNSVDETTEDDPFDEDLEGNQQDDDLQGDLDEMKPLLEEIESDLEDDEDTLQPGKKPEGYDKFPGRRKNRNLPRLDLDSEDEDGDDEEEGDKEDDDEDGDDEDEEEGLTPEELEEQRKELAKERRESEESCQNNLEKIESSRISSIDLRIRIDGNAGEDFPYECPASTQSLEPRQWPQITYTWKAAALCHKPLYFEQVQLERYGHSWGPYVQPILSGVHFFGTLPILPYKMGIRTPNECVYTLGYYRPGSCAPYMIDPVPFTWRAMMFQGVATTGISFIIP